MSSQLPSISLPIMNSQNDNGERGVKGETEILEELIMQAASPQLKPMGGLDNGT